ncbi:hypothetical protein MKX03_025633 [Papaver bracteatum]|nr:hypothetical protein MKX03_025633 [Papaver bracteatum]
MEGSLFPNRPTLPTPTTKPIIPPPPSQTNLPLKFNSKTLPLPTNTPPPPSLPLDSLLQQLLHISPKTSYPSLSISTSSHKQQNTHISKPKSIPPPPPPSYSSVGHKHNDYASIEFLSPKGKSLLVSIVNHPISNLNTYFNSIHSELNEYDYEKSLVLFQWFLSKNSDANNKLDQQAIEAMVRILGRESQHSIASKLFDEISIEDYSLDIRAYTTILHSYSQSGMYEKAISLFRVIKSKGLKPTLVTYNVMLDVYGKMGRSWNKLMELVGEITSNGLEFDEFTCSTVLSACAREGLLEEASKFFNGLKSKGYVPGTVTYNALLHVYGKAGVYSEALSIMEEMERNNCTPDSVTYNELVAAYVREGFYDEGASVIETMSSRGTMPNAVTYTTVINAYGKVGKEDKALSLFDQMKKSGCVPNVCTYNAILGMLGKKLMSEEMVVILSEMKTNGCIPNRVTWNTMLALCGNNGMQKYVNRVFSEMKNFGFEPDRDTFNTLISAYGRCGSGIDASKMYDEMIKSGFTPCVTTYNALLNALSRRGDWKAAESVIIDMKTKGFKPNETSYSLILQCYAKVGYVEGIRMIEYEIYSGRIFPSWMLLTTLVLANAKCRILAGMERAFEIQEEVKEMKDLGIPQHTDY